MKESSITIKPNIWVIGDLQGCHQQLQELLNHPEIKNDPSCQLWFAGDLINRGPASLETLDTLIALEDQAICILGNHDIHCLGVYAGARKLSPSDTIESLLTHPQADYYMDWLRTRPLAHYDVGHLMIHAGVLPQWSVLQTLALAHEVETVLQSEQWQSRLAPIFGNQPNQWNERLTGNDRLRVIINALTRLRMCHEDGTIEYKAKGTPSTIIDSNLKPWFELKERQSASSTLVFGHWSTLGLMLQANLIALDTGCVWGGSLSAVRLHDRKIIQIPNPQGLDPLAN